MAAAILTLFEHQYRAYAEVPELPREPAARERILEQIERLNQAAGQEILQLGRKGLRANALVGVVRAGPLTIEILPKLDQSRKDGSAAIPAVTQNLFVLLAYAYDLPLLELGATGLAVQAGSWFELLTRFFVEELSRQAPAGLPRSYITREESLPVLRGRWDIHRQVQQHPHNRHLLDVIHDEFTADIPLNQIFCYVVEQLAQTSLDPENRARLNDLRAWLGPVTCPAEISAALLESVRFNRLNQHLLPAFNLARLFLSGIILRLSAGDQPAHALVFDMNLLFERFSAAFLSRHHRDILPGAWQGLRIIEQAQGLHPTLGTSDGHKVLRLRPDLLLMRKSQPVLIIDTKYKQLDSDLRSLGSASADLYQALAYATGLACPDVLLLYPQPAGKAIRKRVWVERAGARLHLATIDLRRPLQPPDDLIQAFRAILEWIQQAYREKDQSQENSQ